MFILLTLASSRQEVTVFLTKIISITNERTPDKRPLSCIVLDTGIRYNVLESQEVIRDKIKEARK